MTLLWILFRMMDIQKTDNIEKSYFSKTQYILIKWSLISAGEKLSATEQTNNKHRTSSGNIFELQYAKVWKGKSTVCLAHNPLLSLYDIFIWKISIKLTDKIVFISGYWTKSIFSRYWVLSEKLSSKNRIKLLNSISWGYVEGRFSFEAILAYLWLVLRYCAMSRMWARDKEASVPTAFAHTFFYNNISNRFFLHL